MSERSIDVDPCDKITADAQGAPGNRTFYLVGTSNGVRYTVVAEKIQLLSLASGIEKFLGELSQRNPRFDMLSADFNEAEMRVDVFDEPLFRAGDIGMGFDEEREQVVLLVREILLDGMETDDARTLRFWCSAEQANNLAFWIIELARRGRPTCPQCGLPIEAEGHFCLKKNGHK